MLINVVIQADYLRTSPSKGIGDDGKPVQRRLLNVLEVPIPEHAAFAFRAPLAVSASENLPANVVGMKAKLALVNYREGKFGGQFEAKLVELEAKPAAK